MLGGELVLPNIKSAAKRVKVIQSKTLQNTVRKTYLKTTIRKFKEAIASNDSTVLERYKKAIKAIDKTVAKNILHKNAAARKKSQLTRALNLVNENK